MSYTRASAAIYQQNASVRNNIVTADAAEPVGLTGFENAFPPRNIAVSSFDAIGGGLGIDFRNVSGKTINVIANMTIVLLPQNGATSQPTLMFTKNGEPDVNTWGAAQQTANVLFPIGTSISFSTLITLDPNEYISPTYLWDLSLEVKVLAFTMNVTSYYHN